MNIQLYLTFSLQFKMWQHFWYVNSETLACWLVSESSKLGQKGTAVASCYYFLQ